MKTIDRFLAKVNKTDNCWFWTGYKNPKGYGKITVNYKPIMAHRYSYEYYIDSIPKGLVLDHLCENKDCVNPAHLEPVTNQENLIRGKVGQKNAIHHKSKTHCKNGHEYTEENTKYIQRKTGYIRLTRSCVKCYNLSQSKFKSKRK
jgi:hypothetical protein